MTQGDRLETFYQKHFGMKWPYLNHYLDKLERKALKNNLRIIGVPGSAANEDFKALSIQLPTDAWNTRPELGQEDRAAERHPRPAECSNSEFLDP